MPDYIPVPEAELRELLERGEKATTRPWGNDLNGTVANIGNDDEWGHSVFQQSSGRIGQKVSQQENADFNFAASAANLADRLALEVLDLREKVKEMEKR